MTNHLRSQTLAGAPPPPPPPPPTQPPLALPRRTVDLRIPAIEKYAYCLCLHVKPATIFIAIFKLVRSLLFASILLNSEIAYSDHAELAAMDDRHRSTVIAVNIFSRIIIASVAALAIYAVMYNRAALLMPLYAVLLVDFFFALPNAYNRDPDNSNISPAFDDMKGVGPMGRENHLPRYSFVLFTTFAMIARIYFLCVIWKCYRYLRLIELVTPIRFTDVYPHMGQNIQYPIVRVLGSADSADLGPVCGGGLAPPSYDSVASSMKPPNYEEAIKSDANLYPTPGEQHGHTVLDISNPTTPTHSDQIRSNPQHQPTTPQPPPPPPQQQQNQINQNDVASSNNQLSSAAITAPSTTDSPAHPQSSSQINQQQIQPNSQTQPQRIPSNQIVPTSDPDSQYFRLPTPKRLSNERKINE